MFWHPIWPIGAQSSARRAATPSGGGGRTSSRQPPATWGPEPPSAVDRWLIQVVYEMIADEETCSKCTAALGAGLRVSVSPTFGRPPLWRVAVTTRCRGWRRHRHVADIARPARDMVLGALHLGSP